MSSGTHIPGQVTIDSLSQKAMPSDVFEDEFSFFEGLRGRNLELAVG